MYPALYDPKQRDAKYGGNIAQYLVDCHDTPGVTFNFCGGMMFGLVLSPALRAHLGEVASAGAGDPRQPKLYDASVARMSMKPDGYDKDASADDATVFHGREVRKVSAPPHGSTSSMFIHLSLANGDDVEGWSAEEVDEYSGWMSDRGRRWRDGGVYAAEGKGDWYRAQVWTQRRLGCTTGFTSTRTAAMGSGCPRRTDARAWRSPSRSPRSTLAGRPRGTLSTSSDERGGRV